MLNYVDASITTVDGNFTVLDDPIDVIDGSEWPLTNFTVKVWDAADPATLKAVILVGARTANSLSSLTWNYGGHTDVNIASGDYIALTSTKYDYEIKNYVHYWAGRQNGETAHADDDFFNGSGTPAGTQVAPSGTATWAEGEGVLSCVYDDQSTGDHCALLRPMTPNAAPVTIETGLSSWLTRRTNSPMTGLIFTNGTTSGADAVAFGLYWGSAVLTIARFAGTLTTMTPTNLHTDFVYSMPPMRMRFAWTATNTWGWGLSGQSGPFGNFGGSTFATTLAPTHFGFFVSSWTTTFPSVATYDYFRVADANLT